MPFERPGICHIKIGYTVFHSHHTLLNVNQGILSTHVGSDPTRMQNQRANLFGLQIDGQTFHCRIQCGLTGSVKNTATTGVVGKTTHQTTHVNDQFTLTAK